uniref:thiol oxidase n=1 Tax=viral metagenome TaxID=1070528 RepID=A0A6C0KPM6_9ZZZZ
MQFPPTVWGPFFWHTMHIVALGYPKNPNYTEKKCAKEFYESLAYLIPCAVCREHYNTHIASHPLTTYVDSRKDLLKWTIDIHNKVNKMLHKPEWTEREVVSYYERLGRRNRSPVWTKEDMKEVDYQSFVKGFLTGSFVLSGVGGLVYIINKLQSS